MREFKIGDIVSKISGKPFKGGGLTDVITAITVNQLSPSKESAAILKSSGTMVNLQRLKHSPSMDISTEVQIWVAAFSIIMNGRADYENRLKELKEWDKPTSNKEDDRLGKWHEWSNKIQALEYALANGLTEHTRKDE